MLHSWYIQLLTSIDLLRGPERPPFFELPTLTLRHSPLQTAERARMHETALLSAFIFFFQNSGLKVLFWGKLKFLLPPCLKLLFSGNITYYLDSASVRYLRNGPVFLRTKLSSNQRSQPDISLAHHIISSAQLRPAAHGSASSSAQRRAVPFPGVPWRALACGAVLCDAMRCCAALCRAVPW